MTMMVGVGRGEEDKDIGIWGGGGRDGEKLRGG
jgi:hypothetical protein